MDQSFYQKYIFSFWIHLRFYDQDAPASKSCCIDARYLHNFPATTKAISLRTGG